MAISEVLDRYNSMSVVLTNHQASKMIAATNPSLVRRRRAPAPEEAIQDLEQALGEPLPGDFAAFFRVTDGLDFPDFNVGSDMFFSAAEMKRKLEGVGEDTTLLFAVKEHLAMEGTDEEVIRAFVCGGNEEEFFWVKSSKDGTEPQWAVSRLLDGGVEAPWFPTIEALLQWYLDTLIQPRLERLQHEQGTL